jgi:hypothetical protein
VAARSGQAARDTGEGDFDPAAGVDGTEDQWEEKSIDSGEKIEWEKGKPLIGAFIAKREVTSDDGELLTMLVFADRTAGRVFTWAGPKLKEAFEHVTPGSYVRVEWIDDKDVGRPSPMKMFSVKVRPDPATPVELNPKGPGTAGTEAEPF